MKSLKTHLFSLLAVAIICVPLALPFSASADPDRDGHTPVVWDAYGDGYDLCHNYVNFDFDCNGIPEQIRWTAGASDDGFLVFDRNKDGVINNGSELFGSYTPQLPPPAGVPKNGFNALLTFDYRASGGNADGYLDYQDDIWDYLRIWTDYNQDGITQRTGPNGDELRKLTPSGIVRINLAYSSRTHLACELFVGYSTEVTLIPSFVERNHRMHDVFLSVPQ